jgi:hypothetical protein|tara:strand:- start:91 stop:1077 length:987 start_codon:yes stop_codon:yes gene_type:complete
MNCINSEITEKFAAYNGDCCEVTTQLPDDSIHLSIYSPPFVGLYIYSDSERDMGNSKSSEEFFEHYKFLIRELLKKTQPGRLSIVHCKDLPAYHHRDGYAGLKDFPGEIVRAHVESGWAFHSRVTIWKCPVIERERTNNNGLLHKTVLRDQSQLRQGMADYLLIFRKIPAAGLMADEPVKTGEGFQEYIGSEEGDPRVAGGHPSPYARKSLASIDSINIWRRYAEPVWWDINQTNVLNGKIARENKDEKHICPLQLDLIRRCVQIWSNPGDVVFSPFMGVGSEGVESLKADRRFIGIELKEAYYKQAGANLAAAAAHSEQDQLPGLTT